MNAKGLIEMIVINIGKDQKQTVDGGMEITNPNFRMINQIVLANAPCYVGILVDRGLSGSTRLAANQVTHHVVVLFFGGPDVRKALSYGLRMREHPGINLTVIKLLLGEAALEDRRSDSRKSSMNNDSSVLTVVTDDDKEKQLDEDYISDFSARTANDDSVLYIERVVNHGEETIAAIRTIDHAHDLFIVGRGQGTISPLTTGLIDWSECPRARCKRRSIGILGSCISCFGVSCATICRNGTRGYLLTPDSPGQQLHDHFNFSYHRTQIKTVRSAAEFTGFRHCIGSKRFPIFKIRASSDEEETSESVARIRKVFSNVKDKWDGLEKKPSVFLYGGSAILGLWLSSIIADALDSVPLLPRFLELVGLGYFGWFIYRYLLFKSGRDELGSDIRALKKKITGEEED